MSLIVDLDRQRLAVSINADVPIDTGVRLPADRPLRPYVLLHWEGCVALLKASDAFAGTCTEPLPRS